MLRVMVMSTSVLFRPGSCIQKCTHHKWAMFYSDLSARQPHSTAGGTLEPGDDTTGGAQAQFQQLNSRRTLYSVLVKKMAGL